MSRLPGRFLDYITGFEADASISQVPNSYVEISSRKDAGKWKKAVEEELHSMQENHVWDIVPIPKVVEIQVGV